MALKKICILDCTLRDGGYYTNWDFPSELTEVYLKGVDQLPVDFVELGYISKAQKTYHGAYFYLPDSIIQKCSSLCSKKFSIMLNEKDLKSEELDDLLAHAIDKIDLIRLAVRPENIASAIKTGRKIKSSGFNVAINLMYASEWTNDFPVKDSLIQINNTFDYFYLVDSYGGLFPHSVTEIINYLKMYLDIPIGFHGHNNLELALANSLAAINAGAAMVDSTILGMGRGAGNLKTELILSIQQKFNNSKLDLDVLYNITENFQKIKDVYKWGPQLPYMVSGLHSLPQDAVMGKIKKRYFSLNSFVIQDKPIKVSHEKFKSALNFNKALLIGGGDSVSTHKEALREFLQRHPDILVIYASSRNVPNFVGINNYQIHFLAGNEGKRLESMLSNKEPNEKRVLFVAPEFFSTLNYIPELPSVDKYQLGNTDYEDKFGRSITALILQFCKEQKIKNVYISGYDGYGSKMTGPELELFEENQCIFNDLGKEFKLYSVTPTQYELQSKSIYTLI